MKFPRTPLAFAALLLLALSLPAALFAEGSMVEELDKSAGWGVDRDSGRVAIDASLLVFWDPQSRTLVIHPDYEAEAAADVEAVVQSDGSWLMPDGSQLTPIRGAVMVLTGEETEELLQRTESHARTTADRVDLSAEISEGAQKTRLFSRCTGCSKCPTGCVGALQWGAAPNFATCEPAGLFRTCKRYWRAVCPADEYTCVGCTGIIVASGAMYAWTCGSC